MKQQAIKQKLLDTFDVSRGRARYSTIRDRVVSAAKVDAIHLCQLIAAMLIASIGLNIDSTEAVIGAMLICPLMGSVVALAYSVAVMDMRVLRHAAFDLLLQCGICLATSTVYFLLTPLHVQTSELLANSQATVWDMLIALVGGFAGALGLSRRQEPTTLLSGVAVATALMPPLCATGCGLAALDLTAATSALYEFCINMVFIGAGSAVVFMLLHIPVRGDLNGDGVITSEELAEAQRDSIFLRNHLALMLVLFAMPCLYFSVQMVHGASEDTAEMAVALDPYDTETVTSELEVVCPGFDSYRVGEESWYDDQTGTMAERVVATVVTRRKLTTAQQSQAEGLIRIHVPDLDDVEFEVEGG